MTAAKGSALFSTLYSSRNPLSVLQKDENLNLYSCAAYRALSAINELLGEPDFHLYRQELL